MTGGDRKGRLTHQHLEESHRLGYGQQARER
jgi:hypothetical protein